MPLSRRSRPADIALPPSNSGSESTSPTKATSSSRSETSRLPMDASEPSPLSESYIPPPPGLNSPVSPMTPITPEVLGDWPKDKWDALGLATSVDDESRLSGDQTLFLVSD